MSASANRSRRDSRRSARLALALAFCVAMIGHVHYVNLTFDDVFISFRYAERFASGEGLTYNPQERVEGYSNFLWTVLLALPAALGAKGTEFGMLWSAKLLGMAFNLGTLLLLWRVASRRLDHRSGAGAGALTLYLAGLAPFFVWGVAGLETALLTFLIMGAFHAFWQESSRADTRGWGSAVWLVLAALTRPEPVVLGLFFILVRALQLRSSSNASWRQAAIYCAVFAVPYAAFLSFRWAYYGDLLPNTYYAKLHDDVGAWARGLSYIKDGALDLGWVGLAAVGAVTFVLRPKISMWGALVFGAFFLQLAGVLYEGGDWMPAYRMLVPVFPALCLCVLEVGVAAGKLGLPTKRERRSQARAYPLLAKYFPPLLLAFMAAGVWQSQKTIHPKNLPSGFEGIYFDVFPRYQEARRMKAELEPGLLAIGEAGIVPYLTGFRTIDMFGLTDAHIGHLPGSMHVKFDVDYVLGRNPRYAYLLMRGQGENRRARHLHGRMLLQDRRFLERYSVRIDMGDAVVYERK